MVFLHGFLGDSEDWTPVMEALQCAGHRCVAIDLPGHGATTMSGPCAHVNPGSFANMLGASHEVICISPISIAPIARLEQWHTSSTFAHHEWMYMNHSTGRR